MNEKQDNNVKASVSQTAKKEWSAPEVKEVLSVAAATQGVGAKKNPAKENIFYNIS